MKTNEIITNARNFLKERASSLESDVRYCILLNEGSEDWPAPFPALLYCFSVIDLLGALYSGDASKDAKSTKQSEAYMTEVMKYTKKSANLLQQVFRHKLVHLAEPKPTTEHEGKKYMWEYHHNQRSIHLNLDPTEEEDEFWFRISIWSLVEDIVDSVFKPNGYIHRLESEKELQTNFEKAYNEILS